MVVPMKNASKWFATTTNGDSVNAVATKAGLTQSTLSRHHRAGVFPAETVIAIARAYGADVILALIDTGHLAQEDVKRYQSKVNLRQVPDIDLTAEIYRRAAERDTPLEEFGA